MGVKTHQEMTDERAWQRCQAGHDRHERIVVDTVLGPMTVYDYERYMGFDGYCSGQDDVSRTLALYGRWEPEETAVVRQVLSAGDRSGVFVDVGSHIGWFSRLAEGYGYRAIGFEADAENIELFDMNASWSTVHHVWFGPESEQVGDLGPVELLKIDVEGAEEHVIWAMLDHLAHVRNILMEVSPVFNDGYPALVSSLTALGFDVFTMDGKHFDGRFDFDQTNLLFRRP